MKGSPNLINYFKFPLALNKGSLVSRKRRDIQFTSGEGVERKATQAPGNPRAGAVETAAATHVVWAGLPLPAHGLLSLQRRANASIQKWVITPPPLPSSLSTLAFMIQVPLSIQCLVSNFWKGI